MKQRAPGQGVLDWRRPGLVAGVDEAGRGPLAGPVVAAAVILDPSRPIDGLADSKVLSESRRAALALTIPGPQCCLGPRLGRRRGGRCAQRPAGHVPCHAPGTARTLRAAVRVYW
jgi:hypothetical protein